MAHHCEFFLTLSTLSGSQSSHVEENFRKFLDLGDGFRQLLFRKQPLDLGPVLRPLGQPRRLQAFSYELLHGFRGLIQKGLALAGAVSLALGEAGQVGALV